MLFELPQVIQNFIDASNKPDPAAYVDCFSEEAEVFDEGKTFAGRSAIRSWSEKHHFAAKVNLDPKGHKQQGNETIVVCRVDGDFDKTGLPDLLYLDFQFKVGNDKIERLAIKLSNEAVSE